jgi:hypothetical protein
MMETLAQLPGFTPGFDRFGDVLFVGLSHIRDRVLPETSSILDLPFVIFTTCRAPEYQDRHSGNPWCCG